MSTWFLVFTVSLVGLVLALVWRTLPGRAGLLACVSLVAWLVYVSVLGASGVLADSTRRPPAMLVVLLPMAALLVALATMPRFQVVARAVPAWLLIAPQSFRFVLELFLHQLWEEGLLPRMMTYSGANFDIVMGASAPLVAALVARKQLPSGVLRLWNLLGIALVLNVAVRGMLTTPVLHVLKADFENVAVVNFPYVLVAGFMVPLALGLHILSLRRGRGEGAFTTVQ